MTHFLPPADAVATAVRGLALAHPGRIEAHLDPLYLRARSGNPDRTVALVAGGGSGHEPLHTGLLGPPPTRARNSMTSPPWARRSWRTRAVWPSPPEHRPPRQPAIPPSPWTPG